MDRRAFLLAAAAAPFGLSLADMASGAFEAGSPLAFVTADLDSHVAVIDLERPRVVARIPTFPGPRSIETVGKMALVAHTAHGRISLVDTGARRVRRVLEGFGEPRYTASRGTLAYVTDSARGEVVTVDVRRGSVVARTRVPGPARHVTSTPDGEAIWTALGSKASRIAVLDARDPRQPKLVRTVSPPFRAHDVVAAPNGEHVWVTSGDSRRLAVYERRGLRPLEIIAADAPPQHVAFAGARAFVASGDDGTVRMHRHDGTFVREVEVPVGSYNVTFGSRCAVTPSLDRGTVALLEPNGRVRSVLQITRAAHDACVVPEV